MGTVGASVRPGGSNLYLPGSTNLVIGFSRNPSDFTLPNYTQLIDIDGEKDITHYLKVGREEMARLAGGDDYHFYWAENQERPRDNNNDEDFNWVRIKTDRMSFDYGGGQKGNKLAAVPIQNMRKAFAAQKAMTSRTRRVHRQLELNANWETGHRINVATQVPGATGRWDQSTTQRSDIKRTVYYAKETIARDTFGVVKEKDIVMVANPTTLRKIGVSQEFVNHLIQGPDAAPHLKGDGLDPHGLFGELFNTPIFCEDAVMVTNTRGGTRTDTWVCADNTVYFLARPGAVSMAAAEGASFSTVGIFVYEDMTEQEDTDDYHRMEKGAITDDVAPEVTASITGMKLENVCG